MAKDSNYIQISTTTEKKVDAEKIALALVNDRLAGCVQIVGPITSVYRWQKKIERTEEWLCLIKTKKSLFEKIEQRIRELHPYDVPEIIALPVTSGSGDYLSWLDGEIIS